MEQGRAIGMIDWEMVWRRWRYMAAMLTAAMTSSASPGGCESDRGRQNERERVDGCIMAMLKPSLARLVGHMPAYGRQMASVA